MTPSRGDIVLVAVCGPESSEATLRPHVVVQNDVGNEHAETTVVLPLTTEYGPDRYPHEVLLRARDDSLAESAVILCSQPRTVRIERDVREQIGHVPDDVMLDVDRALEYSLDLGGPLE